MTRQRSRRRNTLASLGVVLLSVLACTPAGVDTDDGNPTSGELTVSVVVNDLSVPAGASVALAASAAGGSSPYAFRWDLNDGPVDIELDEVTEATLRIETLAEPGRYVFRVVVTDQSQASASDFLVVNAVEVDQTQQARSVLVDEAVSLAIDISSDDTEPTFEWTITSGDASIDDPQAAGPMLTVNTAATVGVRVTATFTVDDGVSTIVVSEFDIVAATTERPVVRIETDFGDIDIELDAVAAPLHAANFLQYIDEGYYDGLLFHRNACMPNAETEECDPFVLQGGGFERDGDDLIAREPTHSPVLSEADNGLSSREVYSVALALSGGDPNSGTTQFFINLADNSFLDDQGFTVFGRVVAGTDVVDAIVAVETAESSVISGEDSLPVEDVVINRMIRLAP